MTLSGQPFDEDMTMTPTDPQLTQAELLALTQELASRGLVDGTRALEASRLGDGHSNLTYLVTGGQRELVVRRAPVGGAGYDVLREGSVIAAVADRGVAVPRVLALVEAGVWAEPFFVMERVSGCVITARTPPPFDTPAQRRAISEALISSLAALHAIDWTTTGLRGHPDGFNARHLARIASLIAEPGGAVPPDFRPAYQRLRATVPRESGAVVLHNDYRLGNVMIASDPPVRIAAVLDWELSAVGDPLFDLGYLIASTPDPTASTTPLHELGAALAEPGYLSRSELAERYAESTGADLERLDWHVAFANWKLAVLFELGHRRYLSGRGDAHYRDRTPVLAFLAAAQVP